MRARPLANSSGGIARCNGVGHRAGVRSRSALIAVPLIAAAMALPASAETGSDGSYRVRVMPDPTADVSPYGCANGWVLATDVGTSAKPMQLAAGKTLTVGLTPDAGIFTGNEGMVWRLQLRVGGQAVARSSGPAWRTEVHYQATQNEQVWVYACNRTGYPEATVSWTVR